MVTASSFLESTSTSRYGGIWEWLSTTDHKRIGLLYMIVILFWFSIAVVLGVLVRIELTSIGETVMGAQTYNALFTLHGVIMIFLFLIPAMPAIFGNFLLPMMLGARDLAFPRINLLSWYVYTLGGLFTMYAVFSGGVDTGWTFYTPYSSTYSNTHVIAAAVGVFITGFSSILTGINFIATTHRMRAPGLTW